MFFRWMSKFEKVIHLCAEGWVIHVCFQDVPDHIQWNIHVETWDAHYIPFLTYLHLIFWYSVSHWTQKSSLWLCFLDCKLQGHNSICLTGHWSWKIITTLSFLLPSSTVSKSGFSCLHGNHFNYWAISSIWCTNLWDKYTLILVKA